MDINKIKKSLNPFTVYKDLEEAKEQLELEKNLLKLAKVEACDLCFDDFSNHRRGISSADLDTKKYQPVIHITMGLKTIGLCEYHTWLLGQYLLEVADKLKEENNTNDNEMTNDSKKAKIIKLSDYRKR